MPAHDTNDDEDSSNNPPPVTEPVPPTNAPKYIRNGLPKQDTRTLHAIHEYIDDLVEYREHEHKLKLAEQEAVPENETPDQYTDDEWEDELKDAYEKADVPAGAGTVTVNVIDGRGYYYLKGSSNGEFWSQYIAPVHPNPRGE